MVYIYIYVQNTVARMFYKTVKAAISELIIEVHGKFQ